MGRKSKTIAIAFLGQLSLFAAVQAAPIAVTWTGTGTTDFETASNWTGGNAPANDLVTSVATFTNTTPSAQPVLTQDRSITGLSFGTTSAVNNGLTLGGNYTLSIGGSGIKTESSTSSSANSDTISANINVAADQSWVIHNTTLVINGILSGNKNITTTSSSYVTLSGTADNTFNGTFNVTNGRLYLNKAGAKALQGDINISGSANSTLIWSASNQLASTSNITISNGLAALADINNKGVSETFNNLTINGGTVRTDGGSSLTGATDAAVSTQSVSISGGTFTVSGGTQWTTNSLNITGGTVSRIGTSYAGTSRALTVGAGGLNITNIASGAYTPITIGSSLSGKAVNKLVLQGDLTFTGTVGNTNTATIAGDTTNATKGVIEIAGARTFTINGNGSGAAIDLSIAPSINNNGVTASSLTKAGTGTLELANANGYTGGTIVNAGTLLVNNAAGSGLGTGSVAVNGSGALGGRGIIGGIAGAESANVTVSGSVGNLAVLAPGSQSASGHTLGTLTIGSATVNNNLTLGDYSDLVIHFSADGLLSDQLVVTGALDISDLSSLDFVIPTGTTLTDTTYTLISGFSGLTGQFATGQVNGVPDGYNLEYNTNSIQLVAAVPEPLSLAMLAGSGFAALLIRKRR